MELIGYLVLFAVSLFVLLKSSDYFVDSAERLGLAFGISPFIIGVTIVACGTSLPELATGIFSTITGNSEIVGGTVIGSNITNILLVLGITVVVAKKIVIPDSVLDKDMPMLLIASLLFYFTLQEGGFSVTEGLFFIAGLVFFILSTFKDDDDEEKVRSKPSAKDFLILVAAGAGVSIGASYTVTAIEQLSIIAGVPKDVISLSIVALGTSLPEVVVSVAAVRKGKQAIAVGNVLGSNIFNTYAVVGISRFFGPLTFAENTIDYSVPFMLAVTFVFAIICLSKRINRWEGAMLLLLYGYYMVSLIEST